MAFFAQGVMPSSPVSRVSTSTMETAADLKALAKDLNPGVCRIPPKFHNRIPPSS